jgi:hypothetical protein
MPNIARRAASEDLVRRGVPLVQASNLGFVPPGSDGSDSLYPQLSPLPGPRRLRRGDGRTWASVLEPIIRDTAVDLSSAGDLGLDELDWLVSMGLVELARYPFPETVLHLGPDDLDSLDPLTFASFLVAHRAERLLQLIELSAGALDNLEHSSLQLSAVAARALFEIAAVSNNVHSTLSNAWCQVHGSPDDVRAIVSDPKTAMWQALWTARVGTRQQEAVSSGWPSARNIQTHLDHFGGDNQDFQATVKEVYASLCEATHPNVESQAVFWRLAPRDAGGRSRIRFEPSGSQSPVKLAIVDAVRIAYRVILNYCRDLWWVVAEVASTSDLARHRDISGLGIPQPGGRNDFCCCGSGLKTKVCTHEVPSPLSDDWKAFAQEGPGGNDDG